MTREVISYEVDCRSRKRGVLGQILYLIERDDIGGLMNYKKFILADPQAKEELELDILGASDDVIEKIKKYFPEFF